MYKFEAKPVHPIGYDYTDMIAMLPLDTRWTDVSWRNDVCNSVNATVAGIGDYAVWFNYLNPSDREVPGSHQFMVTFGDDMATVISSNDFDEVRVALIDDLEERWRDSATYFDDLNTHPEICDQLDPFTATPGYAFADGSYIIVNREPVLTYNVVIGNVEQVFQANDERGSAFDDAVDCLWQNHSRDNYT